MIILLVATLVVVSEVKSQSDCNFEPDTLTEVTACLAALTENVDKLVEGQTPANACKLVAGLITVCKDVIPDSCLPTEATQSIALISVFMASICVFLPSGATSVALMPHTWMAVLLGYLLLKIY